MYSKLLKLCSYEPDEIEQERPRIDRAFQILEIGPEDVKRAEERVSFYFDIELEGARKVLGVCMKELIDLVLAREEGKKIIYTSFPSIPGLGLAAALTSEDVYCQSPELVLDLALGQIFGKIEPILEEAEKSGLPPGLAMCSLNQARFGGMVKGIIPVPDVSMVSGFFCDQISKVEEHLHERYGYPVVYIDQCMGDSPWDEYPEITDRRINYFGEEINRALGEIQRIVGIEISDETMKKARYGNTGLWVTMQEINKLMLNDPAPLDNVVIGMAFWMIASLDRRGSEGLPTALDFLLKEGKKRVEDGIGRTEKGAPKIFFLAHHFTDPAITRLIADVGLCMVAGKFHTLSSIDYSKPRSPKNDFGRRRAERMLRFGLYHSTSGAVHKAIEICKDWGVEGVVIFSHYACRPGNVVPLIAKKVMEDELGLPVLFLEGDYYDTRSYSAEALRTRLETYASMLRVRKAAK